MNPMKFAVRYPSGDAFKYNIYDNLQAARQWAEEQVGRKQNANARVEIFSIFDDVAERSAQNVITENVSEKDFRTYCYVIPGAYQAVTSEAVVERQDVIFDGDEADGESTPDTYQPKVETMASFHQGYESKRDDVDYTRLSAGLEVWFQYYKEQLGLNVHVPQFNGTKSQVAALIKEETHWSVQLEHALQDYIEGGVGKSSRHHRDAADDIINFLSMHRDFVEYASKTGGEETWLAPLLEVGFKLKAFALLAHHLSGVSDDQGQVGGMFAETVSVALSKLLSELAFAPEVGDSGSKSCVTLGDLVAAIRDAAPQTDITSVAPDSGADNSDDGSDAGKYDDDSLSQQSSLLARYTEIFKKHYTASTVRFTAAYENRDGSDAFAVLAEQMGRDLKAARLSAHESYRDEFAATVKAVMNPDVVAADAPGPDSPLRVLAKAFARYNSTNRFSKTKAANQAIATAVSAQLDAAHIALAEAGSEDASQRAAAYLQAINDLVKVLPGQAGISVTVGTKDVTKTVNEDTRLHADIDAALGMISVYLGQPYQAKVRAALINLAHTENLQQQEESLSGPAQSDSPVEQRLVDDESLQDATGAEATGADSAVAVDSAFVDQNADPAKTATGEPVLGGAAVSFEGFEQLVRIYELSSKPNHVTRAAGLAHSEKRDRTQLAAVQAYLPTFTADLTSIDGKTSEANRAAYRVHPMTVAWTLLHAHSGTSKTNQEVVRRMLAHMANERTGLPEQASYMPSEQAQSKADVPQPMTLEQLFTLYALAEQALTGQLPSVDGSNEGLVGVNEKATRTKGLLTTIQMTVLATVERMLTNQVVSLDDVKAAADACGLKRKDEQITADRRSIRTTSNAFKVFMRAMGEVLEFAEGGTTVASAYQKAAANLLVHLGFDAELYSPEKQGDESDKQALRRSRTNAGKLYGAVKSATERQASDHDLARAVAVLRDSAFDKAQQDSDQGLAAMSAARLAQFAQAMLVFTQDNLTPEALGGKAWPMNRGFLRHLKKALVRMAEFIEEQASDDSLKAVEPFEVTFTQLVSGESADLGPIHALVAALGGSDGPAAHDNDGSDDLRAQVQVDIDDEEEQDEEEQEEDAGDRLGVSVEALTRADSPGSFSGSRSPSPAARTDELVRDVDIDDDEEEEEEEHFEHGASPANGSSSD